MIRHFWLPVSLAAASAFLAACGSTIDVGKVGAGADSGTMGTPGAAPPGTLVCKASDPGGANECTCTVGGAKSGACSPQSVGSASHCCAAIDGSGATTQCTCSEDPPTCTNYPGQSFCACSTVNQGFNGARIAECPKPAGGHCCRPQGRADCTCAMNACARSAVEVDSCSPANAILTCLAPAIAVTTCQ
jgi:hypothetical protein